MSSLEFFHPARTQPFIITFFQVVMAFKRVCKFMRRRTGIVRISISSRKRSNFKHEMRRSQQHLTEVTRGSHVIDSSAVPEYDAERERAADPILSAVAPISFAKVKINPLTKRQKMFQSVARQVAKFNVAQRTKSMTAAERLERALVVKKADDHAQNHASTRSGAVADAGEASNRRSRRSTIRNRSQSVVQLAMKQSDIMATHATEVTKQDAVASAAHRDFMQGITNQLLVSEGAGNADSFDPQNDLEYVSGTAIYYGAVIALQVLCASTFHLATPCSIQRGRVHSVHNLRVFIIVLIH